VKILIVLQLTHQVFVSNLLTFGNNPFEDEDDDCIIAQMMVHKKDAITKPIGLNGNSMDLLGIKKEKTKNGDLYMFSNVNEDNQCNSHLNSITKEKKIGKETLEDIGQMAEKDLQKPMDLGCFLSFLSNCVDIGIDQTLKSPHVSTLNVPFKLGNEKNGLENNWYDRYKGNNFHGYKPYEFQTNKMGFQKQKWYVAQEQ
jgi:hypothetical protein